MQLEIWKQRKEELGWTLDVIAEKSGISRTTIARIFSGNPNYPRPTLNTVEAIEKALGLTDGVKWTEEDKALGVGSHPILLSEDEQEWLELRSEILRVKGDDYLRSIKTMLNAIIKENE